MVYVLIVIMHVYPTSVFDMQEFSSKTTCEKAALTIKKMSPSAETFCVLK